MTTRKEARQRLDVTTAQISTLVRTLALGVLAVTWLFLSGDADAPPILSSVPVPLLLFIACLAVLAIVCDLVQYIVAYRQELKAYKAADAASDSVTYDETSWEFRWRAHFFEIKKYLALVAAAILVLAIAFVVARELICC